jgi:hypothetical protein
MKERVRTLSDMAKVLLAAVVLLAGCGGGNDATQTTTKPALNAAVASRLAAASDAVAEALDQNDVCLAAGRADDLKDAVVEAINNGEVPQPFQEDLSSRANELVNEVNCPPPPTETKEDEKKKEHKKKKQQEPPPPPTESTPTDTTPTNTTGG